MPVTRGVVRSVAACCLGLVWGVGCGGRSALLEGTGASQDAGAPAVDAGPVSECMTDEDCPTDNACQPRVCNESGQCEPGPVVQCDDGDPCTEDRCVPQSGECRFRPLALDEDGDGFKGPRPGFAAGEPGSCGDDCDDTSAAAFPGGTEICDGVDNDCNGVVDDGQIFTPADEPLVRLTDAETEEAGVGGMTWDGQNYGISYAAKKPKWRNFFQARDGSGSLVVDETRVSNVAADAFTGPTVWTGSVYGTAWEDRRGDNYEVFFNRLDRQGNKLGPDIQVTNAAGFSLHVHMIFNGADFMLAFSDERSGDYRIYGQRIGIDAVQLGSNVPLTPAAEDARQPFLVEGQRRVGMAFNLVDQQRVGFMTFEPDFTDPSDVLALSSEASVNPTVVYNEGSFVVAWHKKDGVAPGDAIWGATISEDGSVLRSEQRLTFGASFAKTHSMLPLGDRVLLVWADDRDQFDNFELYAKMISSDLQELTLPQRITRDPNDTANPIAVFGPDGDVGIAFRDRRSGSWQPYFTRLRCVGSPE